MKNLNIFIAFAALAITSSCIKETEFNNLEGSSELMEGLIVENKTSETKCNGGNYEDILFSDMPYLTDNGDTLYISAFLSDMGSVEVEETKGAPINNSLFGTYSYYNEIFTRVYESNGIYTSSDGTTDTTMDDVKISYSSGKWSFGQNYYWPLSDDLYFIGIAPYKVWENGQTTGGISWNSTNKKYSFTYDCLPTYQTDNNTDAEDQFDLLYAFNKQNKGTNNRKVKLEFKHACVGVRFEKGDIFGTIESITLNNFFKNARITIGENSIAFDNYSGYSDGQGEWTQLFNYKASDQANGDALDKTTNNEKTFMVIPQLLVNGTQTRAGSAPDAELIIKIGNTLHPEKLSFKDLADPSKGGNALLADWSGYAGNIITFRLSSEKANKVSVDITDTVEGCTKKDIVITNDGKSAVYIRACLVGNWLNVDGKVLTSWSETGTNIHGTFTSKNNYFPNNVPSSATAAAAAGVNWVKGADGFYYYTKIIESGHNASQPIFETFTVTSKPADNEGNWNTTGSSDESMQITNFEMAILVQAVSAQTSGSGTLTKDYAKVAWGSAVDNYLTTESE